VYVLSFDVSAGAAIGASSDDVAFASGGTGGIVRGPDNISGIKRIAVATSTAAPTIRSLRCLSTDAKYNG
jgi:hypothetical protein